MTNALTVMNSSVDWNSVFAECQPKLQNYLRSRINHKEDAEDLAQQVLFKAYRLRDRFDPEKSSPTTWVYIIARTALIDFYRTSKTTSSLDAADGLDIVSINDDTPEMHLLNEEAQESLADALEQLNKKEQDLIVLRYYEGASLTDIAVLMDLPYGQVKRLHTKALHRMHFMLARLGYEG